jgi:hypothetical protein
LPRRHDSTADCTLPHVRHPRANGWRCPETRLHLHANRNGARAVALQAQLLHLAHSQAKRWKLAGVGVHQDHACALTPQTGSTSGQGQFYVTDVVFSSTLTQRLATGTTPTSAKLAYNLRLRSFAWHFTAPADVVLAGAEGASVATWVPEFWLASVSAGTGVDAGVVVGAGAVLEGTDCD